MTNVVIFTIRSEFKAGKPDCFQIRSQGDLLPTGSVVFGFMVLNDGQFTEAIDEPKRMSDAQRVHWERALYLARVVLNNHHSVPVPR